MRSHTGTHGSSARPLCIALLAGLAACAPGPPPDADDPAAVAQAIEATIESYLAAITSVDSAALRQLLVDDTRFSWIEDGEVRYRSPDDVLAGLASLPPGTAIHTELGDITAVPIGVDGGYAYAPFTTTFGEGASAFSFGGVLTFVLERSAGEWRLVGGHTSTLRSGDAGRD